MEIVINFKNYKKGKQVLKLAKKIKKVNKNILIAPPSEYLSELSNKKFSLCAQHLDPISKRASTGFKIPELLKSLKIKYTLLNHTEHPISLSKIKASIKLCKKYKIKVIVCIPNLRSLSAIKKLKPYAIAYEDPKLIATGNAITKHNPKSIIKFAKELKRTNIKSICGAGVSSKEDIIEAKKLGCNGVLIASAIAKNGKVEILR